MNDKIQSSIQTRGKVLDQVCWIEDTINEIISLYFCDTVANKDMFQYEIIEHMSFEKKINIIRSIVKHLNHNLIRNNNFIARLNKLRFIRNKLAHRPLDILNQNNKLLSKNEFYLKEYINGKLSTTKVTQKNIDHYSEECDAAIINLLALKSDLISVKKR